MQPGQAISRRIALDHAVQQAPLGERQSGRTIVIEGTTRARCRMELPKAGGERIDHRWQKGGLPGLRSVAPRDRAEQQMLCPIADLIGDDLGNREPARAKPRESRRFAGEVFAQLAPVESDPFEKTGRALGRCQPRDPRARFTVDDGSGQPPCGEGADRGQGQGGSCQRPLSSPLG